MVFNWFRRQFTQTSSEASPETVESSAAESPEATPETESKTEATEAAAEQDYLNWAKAAYKNIQQRQQEAQTETPAEAAPEPAAVETEPEPEPPVEAAPEPSAELSESLNAAVEAAPSSESAAIEAPTVEPNAEPVAEAPQPQIAVEPEVAAEAERQDSPDEAPAAEIAAPGEAPAPDQAEAAAAEFPEEEPEAAKPAASLPFWARAEADRQERLERLKETAIAEEEPEPVQPAATEPVPELAFDEGFLWSAEVLAAQGRRPEEISIEEITWLKRLRQGLDKTRRSLVNQLKAIVGQGPLNQEAVQEIETLLLQADAGVEATDRIIEALQNKLRQEALPPEAAIAYLKQILRDILDQPFRQNYSPTFVPEHDTLNIWLLTGVNGVGKTTTIGKIAHVATESGYRCLIAAADTFRAAAVEQVKIWGERSGVDVIANPGQNTDPAAVVFDAITAAQSRDIELLLVDTAGRLQNKQNLMEELKKIRRIVDKKAGDAKVESLLVLDATLGQNGLRQAEVFAEAAQLTGVVLTKLDGTAKGGVALAVVQQLGLPIRFIGAGEGITDLRPFSSYEFVEALLSG